MGDMRRVGTRFVDANDVTWHHSKQLVRKTQGTQEEEERSQ